MKLHQVKKEYDNITFNLYRTDEPHWTMIGDFQPDTPTLLIEFDIKRDSRTKMYNIDPTNIDKFKDSKTLTTTPQHKPCILCGEKEPNLIYHKKQPNHHYHKECHQKLINKIQTFINEHSSSITALNI